MNKIKNKYIYVFANAVSVKAEPSRIPI